MKLVMIVSDQDVERALDNIEIIVRKIPIEGIAIIGNTKTQELIRKKKTISFQKNRQKKTLVCC